MQGDFFQVLRRVQMEERNKGALARVENDFYKQLRDYIKDLERSVASDPFGNEQLLLNNAQRIATEICELRESKITKAANNNIYRSFLLFKKDKPQFDLLDTTPLNLTDEEETLYFALMDALRTHRYRISLDEYTDESVVDEDLEEELDDEEFDGEDYDEGTKPTFEEKSYDKPTKSIENVSSPVDDEMEEEISNTLGESGVDEGSYIGESDEVLDRLGQIKDAKVVTDEKYEHIDTQVANQMYPSQDTQVDSQVDAQAGSQVDGQVDAQIGTQVDTQDEESGPVTPQEELGLETQEPKGEVGIETQEAKEDVQSNEESPKIGYVTDNIEDLFKDPDSQFVALDDLEPNYDDDFYNSIAAGSNYAAPSEDDFNMIFAKPKKPKVEPSPEIQKPVDEVEKTGFEEAPSPTVQPTESELGFSSGLDVKEGTVQTTDGFNKAMEEPKEELAPKKPVDKTRGGLFTREEAENATVVINEDVGEMVGIDGKVYGPFLENDVVILPNITAQILIENNKASLVKL